MSEPRYLVYRNGTYPGLGHTLYSILTYARFARATGRVFALDMRGFLYLSGQPPGSFFDYFRFEFPNDLTVVTDIDQIDDLYLAQDIRYWAYIDDLTGDFEEQVVVIPGYNPTPAVVAGMPEMGQFRIDLTDKARTALDAAQLAPSQSGGRIGIHFRHGNGEKLHRRFDRHTASDYEAGLDHIRSRYIGETESIRQHLGEAFDGLFVASDNAPFRDSVAVAFPSAPVAIGNPPDVEFKMSILGQTEQGGALLAAIADLWSLSACDYLVCGDSLFTDFAVANSETLSLDRVTLINDLDLFSGTDTAITEKHLRQAENAIEKYPNHPQLLAECVRVFEAMDRPVEAAEAEATWKETVAIHRNLYWFPAMIDALVRGGQKQRALDQLKRGIAEHPGELQPYQQLIHYLEQDGDSEEVGRLARLAVNSAKRTNQSYPILIRLFRRIGDKDGLHAIAEEALERYPDETAIQLEVGSVRFDKGDFEGAEPLIRGGLRGVSTVGRANFLLARCLEARGRPDEAVAYAREACRLNPNNRVRAAYLQKLESREGTVKRGGILDRLSRIIGIER